MKRKLIAVVTVITVVLTAFCLIFGDNNFIVGSVRTAFSPFLTFTSKITVGIKDFKSYFTELRSYKEENSELAREVSELRKSVKSISQYQTENKRLSELLDLKGEMEDKYNPVAAKVVSYEPNNWYDTFIINKGKWSGISVGDAVISTSGLVGKVSEVGAGYSVISTILDINNSIGARNVRSGELALIEGDVTLSKTKLCKMTYIENKDEINIGDLIETTGSGGIFPEGISIGVVKEIKAENSMPYAVIKPSVDMSDVYEVIVVCRGEYAENGAELE